MGGLESVKNPLGPKYINHVAACFILVSPLEIQHQQQQEKECLMVNAAPSDLGHGNKKLWVNTEFVFGFLEPYNRFQGSEKNH